ncbi:MAG: hypothetical protein IAA89_01260 [Firmicutes bacterium]|uniref:Uncharacterized protein n=1 Tax=Candidatus Gallilactobacillus intestinavium TaxID=2840838 RepID=A0A9D9E6E4_9LACO|nr:hypothetical protein [Candidatus Gallilactobacillus intestinavium]
MKKTELHELIKSELNYVKEKQSFANAEEATGNIATDIFTAEDWDNPNALDSLREDLNSLTVVDEDEAVEWIEFELVHSYGYNIENISNDIERDNLVADIQSIHNNTIYMSDYNEYWTEF